MKSPIICHFSDKRKTKINPFVYIQKFFLRSLLNSGAQFEVTLGVKYSATL